MTDFATYKATRAREARRIRYAFGVAVLIVFAALALKAVERASRPEPRKYWPYPPYSVGEWRALSVEEQEHLERFVVPDGGFRSPTDEALFWAALNVTADPEDPIWRIADRHER